MPNKKLTDAEIIKALEYCIGWENCKEKQCPMINECKKDVDASYRYALDLINRLQADRDNYKQIAENQQKIILDKAFENKKLKAEIERLTKSVTTLTKSISELTDEVERQKKAKDESFLFAANILESEKTVIAETKAEAYKECIEKASNIITEIYNKHIFGNNDLEAEEKDAIINFSDDVTYKLDNLLKELGTKK